ncbi:MAG: hypothetical protein M0R33_18725 [Methylomonas sp.]|nr:hypothetical protein [Methylomonas sp.]MCK9608479.1 hypothetical protein [Methylomonas sp.]
MAMQVVGDLGAVHDLQAALPSEDQQGLIQRLGRDIEILFQSNGFAVSSLGNCQGQYGDGRLSE